MAAQKFHTLMVKGPDYHPFDNFELIKMSPRVLVIKIPCQLLRARAVCLNEFRTDSKLATAFQTQLHLLLHVLSERNYNDRPGSTIAVLERIPHRQDDSITVAWRLWIFISEMDKWEPGWGVDKIIRENLEDDINKEKQTYARSQRPSESASNYLFHKIRSMDDYLALCNDIMIGGLTPHLDKCTQTALWDGRNLANPYHIWSVQHAMQGLRHASPEFVNLDNYLKVDTNGLRATKSFMFPYPDHCWRLTEHQISLREFTACYHPLVEADLGRSDFDRRVFDEMYAAIDVALAEHKYGMLPQMLPGPEFIPYVMGQTSSADSTITMTVLRTRNKHSWEQIIADHKKLKDQGLDSRRAQVWLARNRRAFEKKAAEDFATVWNSQAAAHVISPAQRATVEWGEQYINKGHKNFCGWSVKLTKNMDRISEWFIRVMHILEFFYRVYVAHDSVALVILSHFNADYPDNNKLHYLGIGPFALSKSFGVQIVDDMACPGTRNTYTYSSAKADTGSPCLDGHRAVYHEMSEKWLGVKANAQAQSAQDSDAVNIFKSRLTEGVITFAVPFIDSKTGERKTMTTTVKANMVFNCLSNITLGAIDPAIVDRFVVYQFMEVRRAHKTMEECMTSIDSPDFLAAKQRFVDDFRRTQYVFCMVGALIGVHAMQKPFLWVAERIMIAIIKKATQLGLGRRRSARVPKKVMATITTLVILDAVSWLIDSPTSPIRDLPWQDRYCMLCQPLLYATERHVVLALGLLKGPEFENRLVVQIRKAIKSRYFPDRDPEIAHVTPATNASASSSALPNDASSASVSNAGQRAQKHPRDEKEQDVEIPESKRRRLNPDVVDTEMKQASASVASSSASFSQVADEKEMKDVDSKESKYTEDQDDNEDALNNAQAQDEEDTYKRQKEEEEKLRKLERYFLEEKDEKGQIKRDRNFVVHKLMSTSSNQQRPWTKLECLNKVTAEIRPYLTVKPSEQAIAGVLNDMLGQTVEGTDGKDIPTLRFEHGNLVVASVLFTKSADSVLEDAVRHVLRHKFAKKKTLAFDLCRDKNTYVFNTINIDKDPNRILVVNNTSFVDEKASSVLKDMTALPDGTFSGKVENAFDKAATIEFDEDVGEYARAMQMLRIGWTPEECAKYGIFDEDTMQQNEIKAAKAHRKKTGRSTKLPTYPHGLFIDPDDTEFSAEQSKARKDALEQFQMSKRISALRSEYGLASSHTK